MMGRGSRALAVRVVASARSIEVAGRETGHRMVGINKTGTQLGSIGWEMRR
jgi:hypothetical protein